MIRLALASPTVRWSCLYYQYEKHRPGASSLVGRLSRIWIPHSGECESGSERILMRGGDTEESSSS